jgi:hypothetical protein
MLHFRSWRVIALLTLALLLASVAVPTTLFAREPLPPGLTPVTPPSEPVLPAPATSAELAAPGYLSERGSGGEQQPPWRPKTLPEHIEEIRRRIQHRPWRDRDVIPVPDPGPRDGDTEREQEGDSTQALAGSTWSWEAARPLDQVNGQQGVLWTPILPNPAGGFGFAVDSGTRTTEVPPETGDPVTDAYSGLLQRFELFRSW